MPPRNSSTDGPHRRCGLAPLELVLSLPIMLFVMGLMIIFGTAGAWKVRTLAASRQAVWRTIEPRTGDSDPHPQGWPGSAEMSVADASPSVYSRDPWDEYDVVRGPTLVDPDSGTSLPVQTDLLDATVGLRDGYARIERDFPLLAKMPPHGIDFRRHHQILEETRWEYRTLGIPSNLTRRILFLYPMDLQSVAPEVADHFTSQARAIAENPRKADLVPLEGGDPEIFALPLTGHRSPDFQPKLRIGNETATIPALRGRPLVPRYCEGNPDTVRRERVESLLGAIRRVPRRMADYYIGAYQREINALENSDPPYPGAQGIIDDLRQKINQLQQFRSSL